ncbi:MAG: SDR family NAD(P)-dependent oxidoreductase [Pseudomonadota bacterium]
MEDYLRQQLAGVLQMPSSRIDVQAPLETYGIDSVLAMTITRELEKSFGTLSKTLLFEYQTLAALARYLNKAFPEVMRSQMGTELQVPTAAPVVVPTGPVQQPARRRARVSSQSAPLAKVAIIGISGQYPQAADLNAYWENLKNGKDCIIEIPVDRWENAAYFDADKSKAGKTYGKWGGFMSDIDCFDPLFFGISPKEAERIDPQERLFLQTTWKAVEDAGYSKQSLAGRRVGVYVGVMWAQYELLSVEARLNGATDVAGSSHASIANRVSYLFDWHGPSIALDTMCSSSLTAMHLACEAIRSGEIEAAIAGGVNVSIHPQKYLGLSQGSFLSTDGRCRSFGEGGDGYVPGEGVGAFMLKRLDAAERDGDHVYAVIRANGVNHGGKTNGYSVPNPQAQGELIREVLKRGAVAPDSVNYVEAHGTGTALGDPIEIKGLLAAFGDAAAGRPSCPIGSVKSNIGHLEAAAGVAAVTKVLLQLKHRQLAPSLHALPANPYIDFAATPFHAQTELAEWTPPAMQKRRACVSSFGAGGSNAHLVLDEYQAPARLDQQAAEKTQLFLLSARDADALCNYAREMLDFLATDVASTLADIAYTSQVGRISLGVRLAIVAADRAELHQRLQQWLAAQETGTKDAFADGVFHGDTKALRNQLGDLISGGAGKSIAHELLGRRDLSRVAQLWTLGVDIDWSALPRHATPMRVALPTYPFARQRYWIATGGNDAKPAQRGDSHTALYYRPQWTAQELRLSAPAHDGIMVVGADDALIAALGAMPTASPTVFVNWGNAYAHDGGQNFVLDPAREEDFLQMVAALRAEQRLPSRIVHVCPAEVARGVQALLFHCKAYMTPRLHDGLRLLSVHAGSAGSPNPHGAAVAGFLRALALEEPRFSASTLELDDVVAAQAATIVEELGDASPSAVRYEQDAAGMRRMVRTLVPCRPVQAGEALPVRQRGVYLITGGLGGLGLIFARHLADACQATLILTGRGALGVRQQAQIDELTVMGAQVRYLRGDVANRQDVESAVQAAKREFGALHGVIHAAGVTCDALTVNKTAAQMAQVLAPKLDGTVNLDWVTRDEALDWFVLFSSVAAQIGNVGQCDYAYGNHFMDSYVEAREGLRLGGLRSGQSLSINWPLWTEGGMQVSAADLARMERDTGMAPLPTAAGLRCWEALLGSGMVQGMVLHGDARKISAAVQQATPKAPQAAAPKAASQASTGLAARTCGYLRGIIGEESKLAADCIDVNERFEAYGFDSVMVARVNARLESDLGPLSKTLMFEHETVAELAQHLLSVMQPALAALLGNEPAALPPVDSVVVKAVHAPMLAPAPAPVVVAPAPAAADEPIAIIGLHGMLPGAADLDAFWQQLKQGQDMIDIVPASRWNYRDFDPAEAGVPEHGAIYCKWGAFLDDYDKFDPAFFNISAEEARSVDPQERLFLQSVWSALEDAGYTRDALRERHPKGKGSSVGVYVGVTTNSYHLCASGESGQAAPAALPWSIANRVSYFFDFEGPSMPVDTACSSSLVAMHLACESLRHGECEVAVAGGVNLYLHPSKYQSLCSRHMTSSDGKCRSYGADGDGFVPGEGIGSLILKPLSKAIADGDQVYAVVRASAYAHSGRSNGYSAPNPNAQAGLIEHTLARAGIHPESISYVEGHGTGTPLGDGIEIAALTKAFRRQSSRNAFCAVGSVKANIGHAESAAGIAGVTKVLLQMKHRQLVPTIHSEVANPNIDFGTTPFFLQRELAEWSAGEDPRRALVNSFGAGGVNACVVLEEYQRPASSLTGGEAGLLLPLSARTEAGLVRSAQQLVAWLKRTPEVSAADACYTMQLGREAMEERLAVVAGSRDELIARLDAWHASGDMTGIQRGRVDKRRAGAKRPSPAVEQSANAAAVPDLATMAQAWVRGATVSWTALYSGETPVRIGMPAYPFEKQRYWINDGVQAAAVPPSLPVSIAPAGAAAEAAMLHPLVSHNASTLRQTSFISQLSSSAFHAVDHQVNQQPIFPGAGYLEIAAVCGALAAEQPVLKLRDIVWAHPLSFEGGSQMLRTVLKPAGGCIEYSISSLGTEHERVIHSEGKIELADRDGYRAGEGSDVAIASIMQECASRHTGEHFYAQMRRHGLNYGPGFQVIQEVHVGASFALARMAVPEQLRAGFGDYTLHPSLVDGALQSVAVLLAGADDPCLPFALDEIDIVRPLTYVCYALAEFAEPSGRGKQEIQKLNIRLFNERGELLVKFGNLYVRRLAAAAIGTDHLLKDAA